MKTSHLESSQNPSINTSTPDSQDPAQSRATPTGKRCPLCGSELLLREGSKGRFLGCAGFPKCVFTMHPEATVPQKLDLACPVCSGAMVRIEGRTGPFAKCTNKDCRKTVDLKGLDAACGAKCEECNAPMVLKHGRRGEFLSCTRYPECKHSRPANNKAIPENTISDQVANA